MQQHDCVLDLAKPKALSLGEVLVYHGARPVCQYHNQYAVTSISMPSARNAPSHQQKGALLFLSLLL